MIDVQIMVMSGVEDGKLYHFSPPAQPSDQLKITIGRKEDNELCLKRDTFISRYHANLHWHDNQWWLEDKNSTNGTFIENHDDIYKDTPVTGIIPIEVEQLFRIGRTWLRIQPTGEA